MYGRTQNIQHTAVAAEAAAAACELKNNCPACFGANSSVSAVLST